MSESLIAGFFAIGGAAVGAGIAFLSGYLREISRWRRERRAAVRLLRSELTTNEIIAEGLIEGDALPGRSFEEAHWQSARFQLALNLTFDQFVDVSRTYFVLPYYQAIMDRVREGQPLTSGHRELLAKWREELAALSLSLYAFG